MSDTIIRRKVISEIDILQSIGIDDEFKLVATYEDGTEGRIGRKWYSSLDEALEAAHEFDDRQMELILINLPDVDN